MLPVSEERVAVGFHQDFQRTQAGALGEQGKDPYVHLCLRCQAGETEFAGCLPCTHKDPNVTPAQT